MRRRICVNMSARKPVIDEHYDDKDNIVVYFERPCVKRGKCKHTIHYLQRNVIQILRIRCLVLSKTIWWSLVLLYLCARVVWRRPPRSALLSTALLQAAVTSQTTTTGEVDILLITERWPLSWSWTVNILGQYQFAGPQYIKYQDLGTDQTGPHLTLPGASLVYNRYKEHAVATVTNHITVSLNCFIAPRLIIRLYELLKQILLQLQKHIISLLNSYKIKMFLKIKFYLDRR